MKIESCSSHVPPPAQGLKAQGPGGSTLFDECVRPVRLSRDVVSSWKIGATSPLHPYCSILGRIWDWYRWVEENTILYAITHEYIAFLEEVGGGGGGGVNERRERSTPLWGPPAWNSVYAPGSGAEGLSRRSRSKAKGLRTTGSQRLFDETRLALAN